MDIIINTEYYNPELGLCEVVERKGYGHPDTIADKLAELCSKTYSKYCLNKYGVILHHNFDKLYIGAGLFRYENNQVKRYSKIKIRLNGRVSNTMNGDLIDIKKLLSPVIQEYIGTLLPMVDVNNDLDISINSTQHSKRHNWFTPADISDIPDATNVFSGDTSLCVSHTGETLCEKICIGVENLFFSLNSKGYPVPKYNDIGQDIKVMVTRKGNDVDVTICLPVYKFKFSNAEEYEKILKKYENIVESEIRMIDIDNKYKYKININKNEDGTYREYALVKGSCIECGEEGVVGRGNKSSGLISAYRYQTVEAPYGKNERYHTGVVLDFLCRRLGENIFAKTNIKNSILCVSRNKNSLFKPYFFCINLEREIDKSIILNAINEIFDENNYLDFLLNERLK